MPGRIQFDREAVLESAVQVFWRKGFAGTSMEDIKQATGIKESSLYNTFGNKEELYKAALELYKQKIIANFSVMPNLERPRETLIMVLRGIAQMATTEQGAAGCMLMNSAMELGAQYKDIADYARAAYTEIEEWMFVTVQRGQELGEISTERDARSLARYLSYTMQSMFAVARTSPTEEFMLDVADTALSVL